MIRKPYLLFLGDAQDQLAAKTAAGVAHWRPEWCVGQFRLPGCRADLGLDDITLDHGRQLGAATLKSLIDRFVPMDAEVVPFGSESILFGALSVLACP